MRAEDLILIVPKVVRYSTTKRRQYREAFISLFLIRKVSEMKKYISMISQFWAKHGHTVLTSVGCVGTVVSVALAIEQTPKAVKILENNPDISKKEKIIRMVAIYAPVAASTALTITAIWGADIMCANSLKHMAKTLELVTNKLNDQHKATMHGVTGAAAVIGAHDLKKRTDEEGEKVHLFYDDFSERFFELTYKEYYEGIIKVNDQFHQYGSVTLNYYYECLGLSPWDPADVLGWDYEDLADDGIYVGIPSYHEEKAYDGCAGHEEYNSVIVHMFAMVPHPI